MKIWFFTLLFVAGYINIMAQSEPENSVEEDNYTEEESYKLYFIEPSLSLHIPQGRFARNIADEVFLGFSLAALIQAKADAPLFLGAEFQYAQLDNYFSSWDGFFDNGDLAEFDSNVNSSYIGLALITRYYLPFPTQILQPYVEGSLGGRYMYSYQTTTSFFDGFEEDATSTFEQSDFNVFYGAAFGFQVLMADNTFLNIKTRYSIGQSASYDVVRENVGAIEDAIAAFETKQSPVNFIKVDIGITQIF